MLIALAIICAVCEAFFTAMEVALGALSRARLRALIEDEDEIRNNETRNNESRNNESRNSESHGSETPVNEKTEANSSASTRQRAGRLLHLLEHSERLTLAFIIVTSLSLWAAGALLTWQVLSANWPLWTLPILLIAVLVVAEVLPLLVAARNPEGIALRSVNLIERSMRLLSPLIWLLGGMARGVARLWGVSDESSPQVSAGELRQALQAAVEEGVIQSEEREMLQGALDFRDKNVHEVMTPRIDIIGVPAEMSLREVLRVAMKAGHSRLPVYEGSLDKITGIIATKDLIPHLRPGAEDSSANLCARDVVRPAFYLPESKRIASALEDLRRQRTLLAIIVDADGGTAGIVTLEDLLEEIVGDIEDEYDEITADLRIAPDTAAALEAAAVNPEAENLETQVAEVQGAAILAPGAKTVREVEKFWQHAFGEHALLCGVPARDRDTIITAAAPSQSLASLALELFDGVPQTGDHVALGQIFLSAPDRENPENASATATLDLQISAMNGPRIEEMRIEKIALENVEN